MKIGNKIAVTLLVLCFGFGIGVMPFARPVAAVSLEAPSYEAQSLNLGSFLPMDLNLTEIMELLYEIFPLLVVVSLMGAVIGVLGRVTRKI